MKKETKIKKVTTDDLAVMVAKGFVGIDKKFERVDKKLEQHDKAFELVLKEMRESRQEARAHRMEMSLLNRSDISQEREIGGLKMRVERLEEKTK